MSMTVHHHRRMHVPAGRHHRRGDRHGGIVSVTFDLRAYIDGIRPEIDAASPEAIYRELHRMFRPRRWPRKSLRARRKVRRLVALIEAGPDAMIYCPWCGSHVARWGHDDSCRIRA